MNNINGQVAVELAKEMSSNGQSWQEFLAKLIDQTGESYPVADADTVDECYEMFHPTQPKINLSAKEITDALSKRVSK